MSSFVRCRPRAGAAVVVLLAGLSWIGPASVAAQNGVSPVLAARIAAAVGQAWGVDPGQVTLAIKGETLGGVTDTAAFELLGRGEGGWFGLTIATSGGPSRAVRIRAAVPERRLVSARALRPGMYLTEQDIRADLRPRWGPPAVEPEFRPSPGWVVTRTVSPGDLLDRTRVAPPPVVSAGRPVRMTWSQGAVSVAFEGIALADAPVGGRVRVYANNRPGVLVGTVTAPGEVRVP